jgi:2-haloalkanoic acid dehalogenase type II
MADRWATFDCYGTLIDWNGGIRAEIERLWPPEPRDEDEAEESDVEEVEEEAGPAEPEPDPEVEAKLREYHQIEPELQRDGKLNYREVMTEAMRRLGAPEGEEGGLAASLPSWKPFWEVPEALEEARKRGWRLAILSNSDPDLIAASIGQIGVPFDEVIVASEIGSYKPAFMHWLEFQARTRVDRRRHVHVGASSYHDIVPASKLRIPSVWINRDNEPALTASTREREDLVDLADILDEIIPA